MLRLKWIPLNYAVKSTGLYTTHTLHPDPLLDPFFPFLLSFPSSSFSSTSSLLLESVPPLAWYFVPKLRPLEKQLSLFGALCTGNIPEALSPWGISKLTYPNALFLNYLFCHKLLLSFPFNGKHVAQITRTSKIIVSLR